jgi:hypothetical protein
MDTTGILFNGRPSHADALRSHAVDCDPAPHRPAASPSELLSPDDRKGPVMGPFLFAKTGVSPGMANGRIALFALATDS